MTFSRVETAEDLAHCHHIRRVVFIEEQNVSEAEEMDDRDGDCSHYLMWDGETPIATARVLPMGNTAKIQRVAVMKSHRGGGTGAQLMRYVMEQCRKDGFNTAVLGAQTYAIGFYERLGFEAYGPEYDDAGIAHRDMTAELTELA
ncbi:GNAT family N-acetyltransferase [Litoreibacter roseus]|uniref:Acetyltransferase n=1 Tax=Litoreibacter roseus TaxID=2601869 RepID=A0A6N6JDZ2_9RHOB|nr:GNAT family N-acetyltransferase [Litoreibacter roseus]GFE64345.1 acetyltransferase [Litoreibacter roseus]